MGTKVDGRPIIDLDGIVEGITIGISPGSAYALRDALREDHDALSAALEDYENDEEIRRGKS